ncbi:MAG: hypothetical protein ACJ74O_03235 [Frankiaceae bacterium]
MPKLPVAGRAAKGTASPASLASLASTASTDPDAAAVALGALRGSLGVIMLVAPGLLPRLLGADRRTAARLSYLTRMVGIREVALGAGTVQAVRRGTDVGSWLVAQALCDAGDGLTVLGALCAGRVNRLTGGLIVASAVAGAAGDVVIRQRGRRAT